MKKKLLIIILTLLAFFNINVKAQHNPWIVSAIGAYFSVPVIHYFWHDPQKIEDGFYISGTIDAKAVTNLHLNYETKIYLSRDGHEAFIYYEQYGAMGYQALMIGGKHAIINRKAGLLVGLHAGQVCNQNQVVLNYGINLELRYTIDKRLSVSAHFKLDRRHELNPPKEWVPNFGPGINYKIRNAPKYE